MNLFSAKRMLKALYADLFVHEVSKRKEKKRWMKFKFLIKFKDPGSGDFFDPRSGMEKFGYKINIPNSQH